MPFSSLIRELKGIGSGKASKSRRGAEKRCVLGRGRSHVAPENEPLSIYGSIQQSQWACMPGELLVDILRRIEESETSWPRRRDVVSCAGVCRSWRETTKEIARTPEQCGLLTFPLSLKQPGPRDSPIQCYIRRESATSTYRLYLGVSPALSGDASKLLLTAKRIRRPTHTEIFISLSADGYSRTADSCIGKLRSNFLGTKFLMYDSQTPCKSTNQSSGWSREKTSLKKVSPRPLTGNYKMATISYEVNFLRTRGPRRMRCIMHMIPVSAIQEGGTASMPATSGNCLDEKITALPISKVNKQESRSTERLEPISATRNPLVLKNKAPRWHEQLQCWCLNFKGRVTVASVKNFQLVSAFDPSQNVPHGEQDEVILQFGKIGKDIFTMDYRYPLTAFQAFAISLSSFDTKPACE